MLRASTEVTSNSQGTKQTDKAVIVHSCSSSFSTSAVQSFTTAAYSKYDFQIFSRGAVESIKIDKGKATLVYTKSQSLYWEVLNFSPSATNTKFRGIMQGLVGEMGGIIPRKNHRRSIISGGEEIQHKCTGNKSTQIDNNEFYHNKE